MYNTRYILPAVSSMYYVYTGNRTTLLPPTECNPNPCGVQVYVVTPFRNIPGMHIYCYRKNIY